jgi:signal transduction histidine kinase
MKPIRVILIDDDPGSRAKITGILSSARYDVNSCSEYPVAFRMLKTLKGRAVVVCSLKASGGSGLDFLAESLKSYGTLPVILTSARPSVDDLTRALRAGAHDFLKNPCSAELLLESVARATHKLDLALDAEKQERENRSELMAFRSETKNLKSLCAFKGFMISMAAHDFRSILTVLDGYQQIIRQNCNNACKNEIPVKMLEQTSRTIFRLQSMAGTLFDYEAAEKGELRVIPVPFDYDTLLRECAEFYRPYAAQKRVDLDVDSPLPPMRALGDPARVLQIFDNILYNAVKFTPADGRIRIRSGPSEKGFVTALVSDTGEGMPKALIKELMGDSTGTAKKDQTARLGMGLSICKRLVDHQHGKFGLSCGAGGGTTVSISLPAAD